MNFNVLNLVRRPVTEAGFSPVYHAQRRAYNERYSIHEQHAKRWRHLAWACVGVAAVAVGWVGYDDSQREYVPYVVERDHLGDELAVGIANKAAPVDPRTIQGEINRWVYDVRTVSPDVLTEKHNILEAYAHTDEHGAAKGELDEWFSKHIPWERAKDTIVTTTIVSTLPIDPDPQSYKTWLTKWQEETRTRSGVLENTQLHEVVTSIAIVHPKTETDFKKNVSGVFVNHFDWKN